jgi:hypothetical protein
MHALRIAGPTAFPKTKSPKIKKPGCRELAGDPAVFYFTKDP